MRSVSEVASGVVRVFGPESSFLGVRSHEMVLEDPVRSVTFSLSSRHHVHVAATRKRGRT